MKIILYFFSVTIFSLLISACSQGNKENLQPNIIYILADDLGYGDVGAFNPESKIHTPNLDKMASEGMIFTDAHTSSSVCSPTRYGILTGRYNWRSKLKEGVLWGKSKALIPENRSTVASLLKSTGYTTGFIGKWHLGWNWAFDDSNKIDFNKPVSHNPNDLGFDYAYGHIGSLDMPPYVYVENGRATTIPERRIPADSSYRFYREGLISPDFDMEDVTPNFFRRGIKFIQEHAKKEKPFFLYLPLPSPHTPILPTEEWQGKSGLNPYGDFVIMIDDWIGKLLKEVRTSGIEKNTLIIFTSDNGCSPMANFKLLEEKEHFPSYIYRGHKADIFEGGHRVPFIAKWPAFVKSGTRVDKTICSTDFMSTVSEILNIELKDNETSR